MTRTTFLSINDNNLNTTKQTLLAALCQPVIDHARVARLEAKIIKIAAVVAKEIKIGRPMRTVK